MTHDTDAQTENGHWYEDFFKQIAHGMSEHHADAFAHDLYVLCSSESPDLCHEPARHVPEQVFHRIYHEYEQLVQQTRLSTDDDMRLRAAAAKEMLAFIDAGREGARRRIRALIEGMTPASIFGREDLIFDMAFMDCESG